MMILVRRRQIKELFQRLTIYSNVLSSSLQIKLNEIEETFRNPNLLIQSIIELQRKQEESLK